jgi:hypothetical protein
MEVLAGLRAKLRTAQRISRAGPQRTRDGEASRPEWPGQTENSDTWVKMPGGKWQCALSQGSGLKK